MMCLFHEMKKATISVVAFSRFYNNKLLFAGGIRFI